MTTGRINQVYTNVAIEPRGPEKPSRETVKRPGNSFSDQCRRDEGCHMTWQPAPASTHKQPTTRSQKPVRTGPAPRSGLEDNFPKKEKFLQSSVNNARKSKFASPGGPHHRTGSHDVMEAARPPHHTKRPPEQQQDHTAAKATWETHACPHMSKGSVGNPRLPPHSEAKCGKPAATAYM